MKKITTLLMASILAGCGAKYEDIAKYVEQTGQHSFEKFNTLDELFIVNGFTKIARDKIKMGEKVVDGKKVPNMVNVEAKLIVDPEINISTYGFKKVDKYEGMLIKYTLNGNTPEYFLFEGYNGTPRIFTKFNDRFKEITEDNYGNNYDHRVKLAENILKIFNRDKNNFYIKRNNKINELNHEMETAIYKQLYNQKQNSGFSSHKDKPKRNYHTRKK